MKAAEILEIIKIQAVKNYAICCEAGLEQNDSDLDESVHKGAAERYATAWDKYVTLMDILGRVIPRKKMDAVRADIHGEGVQLAAEWMKAERERPEA